MEEDLRKEAQRKEDSTRSQTQADATRTSCLPQQTQAIIKATMPGNTETKHKKMRVMQMMLKPTNTLATLKTMMAKTFLKTWTEITSIDLSLIDMMHAVLMINFNRSSLLMVERTLRKNLPNRIGIDRPVEDQMLSWPTMMILMMRKRCSKP